MPVEVEKAQQFDNICFDLPLKKALAKDATVTLSVHVVLTRAQTPRPAHITQEEPQRVQWESTAYLQTPYPVARQQLKVRAGTHTLGRFRI